MDMPFIPTYSYWLNDNSWYGSLGLARFFIRPAALDKADPDEPLRIRLDVQLWKGPLTLELSQVLATQDFPLLEASAEDDLNTLARWLEEQAEKLNGKASL